MLSPREGHLHMLCPRGALQLCRTSEEELYAEPQMRPSVLRGDPLC